MSFRQIVSVDAIYGVMFVDFPADVGGTVSADQVAKLAQANGLEAVCFNEGRRVTALVGVPVSAVQKPWCTSMEVVAEGVGRTMFMYNVQGLDAVLKQHDAILQALSQAGLDGTKRQELKTPVLKVYEFGKEYQTR